LAESVEADDVATFQKKLEIIKESNFVKEGKKVSLTEAMEEVSEDLLPEEVKKVNPEMKKYVDTIKRQLSAQQ
jgi:hypothetical protein